MKQIIEQLTAATASIKAIKPQTDFTQAALNRLDSAVRNLEEHEKKAATLPSGKPGKTAPVK